MLIAIVFGIIGIAGVLFILIGAENDDVCGLMFGALLILAAGIMFGKGLPDLDDNVRYIPAEIVATNDESTYFGTPDGHIYAVETGLHRWPDDVPYLLNVDTNGTDERTDDEILVVWRAE